MRANNELARLFAWLTLLFRDHTETRYKHYKHCNAVQTLALHNRTGLLKGHSCGPQVVIVRTSDGRPCTDIVQRDTVEALYCKGLMAKGYTSK